MYKYRIFHIYAVQNRFKPAYVNQCFFVSVTIRLFINCLSVLIYEETCNSKLKIKKNTIFQEVFKYFAFFLNYVIRNRLKEAAIKEILKTIIFFLVAWRLTPPPPY